MRLALIADARAENFRRFCSRLDPELDVLALSTFAARPLDRCPMRVLPGLLPSSDVLVKRPGEASAPDRRSRRLLFAVWRRAYPLWAQARIADVWRQARAAREEIARFRPDVTLAFRTQNEGYLAGLAGARPLVLFVQGQDFVLFARRFRLHRALTRRLLPGCAGLVADCARDVELARRLGLRADAETLVVPGNGGVDISLFAPGLPAADRERLIVYPRGVTAYVRTDSMLRAIALLLERRGAGACRFVLLAPAGAVPILARMVGAAGLERAPVEVRAFVPPVELASLLGRAAAIVSPGTSDGTPNSMLEAMACGALPVMGRLDSIEEWVRHGENGLLFDPGAPGEMAACLERALDDGRLRERAGAINRDLVSRRAESRSSMAAVEGLLRGLAGAQARS